MRSLQAVLLALAVSHCTAFSPHPNGVVLTRCPKTRRGQPTRQFVWFSKDQKAKTEMEEAAESSSSVGGKNNVVNTEGMPNLELDLRRRFTTTKSLEEQELELAGSMAEAEISLEKLLVPLGVALLAVAAAVAANSAGVTVTDISETVAAFKADPQATLQSSLDGLGPLAIVYFGALYVTAELLAIPATPLTLSAGYLFGWAEGSLVVLAAGTLSACIGFFIGKTFLRQWVETVLEENPQFKKLDTAIGGEGFKLLVLVRLSPIFPFSLLNYTYGASSISFPTFVAGTLLGFTPSTLGYVYTGLVGKELLLGEGSQPWYVYAGGITLLLGFLKLVTDVATDIVEAIEEE